jgi:hypothetical protein
LSLITKEEEETGRMLYQCLIHHVGGGEVVLVLYDNQQCIQDYKQRGFTTFIGCSLSGREFSTEVKQELTYEMREEMEMIRQDTWMVLMVLRHFVHVIPDESCTSDWIQML